MERLINDCWCWERPLHFRSNKTFSKQREEVLPSQHTAKQKYLNSVHSLSVLWISNFFSCIRNCSHELDTDVISPTGDLDNILIVQLFLLENVFFWPEVISVSVERKMNRKKTDSNWIKRLYVKVNYVARTIKICIFDPVGESVQGWNVSQRQKIHISTKTWHS